LGTRPPLRAALIGCGHISARHVPAWQATPNAELVAVCDLDRARAEERAREFGIEKAYDNVEAMLDAGHAGGATSSIDASWVVPIERKVALHLGDFLIEGVDGALHLDPYDAELRHVKQGETTVLERYDASSPGGAGPLGQGAFNSCIADFAAGVRFDRPFESSAEDNLKTLAITLASYESAARGTAVAPDEAP
jgi:predicted dehydrogenase